VEPENLVGAVTNGHLLRKGIPEELVAEPLDLPGVFRVDQVFESLFTQLLPQMSQFTQGAHLHLSSPFCTKGSLLTNMTKRKTSWCSGLLFAYLSKYTQRRPKP